MSLQLRAVICNAGFVQGIPQFDIMMRMSRGALVPLAAASIAVHVWLGWGMIKSCAPTFDEPVHLAAGYQGLVAGSFRLNAADHPPFAEMWGAIPLLALKPAALYQHPDLLARRVYNFSDAFLYKNRVPAEKMLDTARLWCLVTWGAVLGWAVLSWAWRLSGFAGALAAGALYAFCPVLISNSALVTTDGASTALFFLTFWFLSPAPEGLDAAPLPAPGVPGAGVPPPLRTGSGLPAPGVPGAGVPPRSRLESGRPLWRWLAAGAGMGLAVASKFNMFILPPLVGVMLAAEHRLARGARQQARPPSSFPWPMALAMAAAACLALALVYRFSSVGLYAEGLKATLARLGEGRSSFFHGSHSTEGWLGYFPAALLVKTPIPLTVSALLGLGLWLRSPDVGRLWALGPAAAYFAAALFSRTQIGIRHLLPVFPFLILMGADAAAWAWRQRTGAISRQIRWGAVGMGLWLGVSVGGNHPHHLAYFNEAAGGPSDGYRWFVDSNLDWGQGLKELGGILKDMGNPPVYLCYFGVADPSYYGIRYFPLAFIDHVDRREGVEEPKESDRVLLAVSATNLQATYYVRKDLFAWLADRTPPASAGHSIFLYDLTEDPEGRRMLAAMLEASGSADAGRRLLSRSP